MDMDTAALDTQSLIILCNHIFHIIFSCILVHQLLLLNFKKTHTLEYDTYSPPILLSKFISWNSSIDCCSWFGVTCSTNGHVDGLDISSQSISGGIDNSSSLFDLQQLQSINLADNGFIDGSCFQSAIGKLTNLRPLESPNLSMLFHNLTDLMELHLDGVNISAQGIKWCQAISLNLPDTLLSGPVVQSLAKLQSLSEIQLDKSLLEKWRTADCLSSRHRE
ncbi:receptor-like protein Cf-9 [Malus sylvestris]|uniref:receptor-like protein Cf-9 n=1 Tax=Malus sylvestris TaxID=3752 RepID=UPI0021AC0FF0|nr:receptor-like protein Cf-9 [Malus sylvestris]